METFRMYASVKMNRTVNANEDYICPGGYCMKVGDKAISFDFEESITSIDKENPEIIHIEHRNPDYRAFPVLNEVTKGLFKEISEIEDFFIYTGESQETDLKPVKLLSCTFVFPYQKWEEIHLSKDICERAVMAN